MQNEKAVMFINEIKIEEKMKRIEVEGWVVIHLLV
jgi:hypothetical protein